MLLSLDIEALAHNLDHYLGPYTLEDQCKNLDNHKHTDLNNTLHNMSHNSHKLRILMIHLHLFPLNILPQFTHLHFTILKVFRLCMDLQVFGNLPS